jgi:hypothetical protein
MQTTNSTPQWIPFIPVIAWIAISLFLSLVGGWQALAQKYRAPERIHGERFWLKSAGMRWGVGYRSALNFGVDVQGLFVSIVPIFRIGHPPLFIPWSDISFTRQRQWLLDGVRISFRKNPGVPILLPMKVAQQVFANSPIRLPAA